MSNREWIAKHSSSAKGWTKFVAGETAPGFYWFRDRFTSRIQRVVVHSGYMDDGTEHSLLDYWDGDVKAIPEEPDERD